MKNTILIVDDDQINRKMIRNILTKMPQCAVSIVEAESGVQALEKMNQADPKIQVVILDIMMPDMDGIQVLRQIKQNPAWRDIPVVMCTALNERKSLAMALSLGALDYFTKPLSEEEIQITLPLKVKNALEFFDQRRQLGFFYEHIKKEMQFAERLQKAILPEYLAFRGARMWGRYIACDDIGGDVFFCKEKDGVLWFVIADIAGHGVTVSMMSAMMSLLFSTAVEICDTPVGVLEKINKTMLEVFRGSWQGVISAFVGSIEGTLLKYANAGHPYPVLYRALEGTIETLEKTGMVLGMFNEAMPELGVTVMNAGDEILLYTNGLMGKETDEDCASVVRDFCETSKAELTKNPVDFFDKLLAHCRKPGQKGFTDDVAVMMIQKTI